MQGLLDKATDSLEARPSHSRSAQAAVLYGGITLAARSSLGAHLHQRRRMLLERRPAANGTGPVKVAPTRALGAVRTVRRRHAVGLGLRGGFRSEALRRSTAR